jgi:hypothetical protein
MVGVFEAAGMLGEKRADLALVGGVGLASLYQHQGRYAEAEPLYQRALAIAETARLIALLSLRNQIQTTEGFGPEKFAPIKVARRSEKVTGPPIPRRAARASLGKLFPMRFAVL